MNTQDSCMGDIRPDPFRDLERNPTLDDLAAQIRREHEAAERAQGDALRHACEAGLTLIEVKARLPHGEFMGWVRVHCRISHSTANLYMRVAREWDTLVEANSERVSNLSLGQAARILYTGSDGAYEQALRELVSFGVMDEDFLRDLDEGQRRVLVAEARSTYEEFVEDAARDKHPSGVDWVMDPRALRYVVENIAEDLRAGTIKVSAVRGRLRLLENARAPGPIRSVETPVWRWVAQLMEMGQRLGLLYGNDAAVLRQSVNWLLGAMDDFAQGVPPRPMQLQVGGRAVSGSDEGESPLISSA